MSKAGALKKLYGYLTNEIARGALPKKRQEYFDTFDPNVYYHATIENIDKFNPQMDSSVGAYGSVGAYDDTTTRGATYFTSDRELANEVLDDKRVLAQAEYLRQKRNMGSGQYPDFDVDTVYNPKTDQEFLSGSRIYPLKIKTDKIFDFDNEKDMDRLLDRYISLYSDEDYQIDLVKSVGVGNWTALETPRIQKILKELGYRGYKTNERGTIGLFYPDEGDVRGLYAKFNPKDEKKGEILATVVPYASVGTIGALAGLEEGT
jgi:hypothetical protein